MSNDKPRAQTNEEYVVTPEYTTISMRAAEHLPKQAIPPEEYLKVLRALEQTSQALAIETNLRDILEDIAETIGKALNAKYVNFWTFTPDQKGVQIEAAYGMQQQYIDHSREDPLPLGSAWIGRAMSTGQAWATSNVQKDPYLPKSWLIPAQKQGYHGLLCVPLIRNNKTFGGMCIYYEKVHEFEYFEMSLATIVANQAATAVENTRIFRDLEAERTRTLAIIQSLSDGIVMYDLDGIITLFNSRASELLWIAQEKAIGKNIDDASLAEESVYLKNLFMMSSVMKAQQEYVPVEYVTEGPHKVILKMTRIPVHNAENSKIGTMYILNDITHEKEVEELKASFVSTASHQLRTPLAGIKWSLDALKNETLGPVSDEQSEVLQNAYTVTDQLIGLVNDLLDVSRIEEGRFGYTFEKRDIRVPLKKVFESLRPVAKKRAVRFELVLPEKKPPLASIDAEKLRIAIQNIIDNAIKYTRPDGSVEVKLEPRESTLAVVVRDTGIGIPKKDRELIFNKFYRAKNAVRFQTEGSGLGLYIAKHIVEKHHGVVSFVSETNTGSTFTILLPLEPDKMPSGNIKGL